jgi:hypothetical protein
LGKKRRIVRVSLKPQLLEHDGKRKLEADSDGGETALALNKPALRQMKARLPSCPHQSVTSKRELLSSRAGRREAVGMTLTKELLGVRTLSLY